MRQAGNKNFRYFNIMNQKEILSTSEKPRRQIIIIDLHNELLGENVIFDTKKHLAAAANLVARGFRMASSKFS